MTLHRRQCPITLLSPPHISPFPLPFFLSPRVRRTTTPAVLNTTPSGFSHSLQFLLRLFLYIRMSGLFLTIATAYVLFQSFHLLKAWQGAKGTTMLQDGATNLLTMPQRGLPREPISGESRLPTPKITPEERWPQVYPYMRLHPFPSQHPSQCPLIPPHPLVPISTHGITCPPTLPQLRTT